MRRLNWHTRLLQRFRRGGHGRRGHSRLPLSSPRLRGELLEDRSLPAALFTGVPVSDVASSSIGTANVSDNVGAALDGTIYVVFSSPSGIRVARSTNRGMSFQPSVQVNAFQASEVEIDVDRNGVVYVGWVQSNNAMISRSIDGGLSFSAASTVGAVGSSTGLHMATDPPFVYAYPTRGDIVFTNNNNGVGAFTSVTIQTPQVFSGIFADESTGDVFAISDNPVLFAFVSTNNGTSFSALPLVPGGSIFNSAYTALFGLNRTAIVSGRMTNAFSINLNTGATTDISPFGNNTTNSGRSLATDGCGNVVDNFRNDENIQYQVSQDGGVTFNPVVTVVPSASSSNAETNRAFLDILIVYQQSGNIFLSVYANELFGCAETQVLLDGSNNLVIRDINGGVSNDNLTLQFDTVNSEYVISDPGNIITTSVPSATGDLTFTVRVPFAAVTGGRIIFDTLDGTDSLVLNVDGVNKLIDVFAGIGTNDVLTVNATSPIISSVTHNLTGPGAGDIDFNSDSTADVTYSGLELPLATTGIGTTDLVFNLAGGVTDGVLDDLGAPADGVSQLRFSSNMLLDVPFPNPTNSLTIRAMGGGSLVRLEPMDTGYSPASFTVDGAASDIFRLTGADLIPNVSDVTVAGAATLDQNNFAETLGSLAGTGNVTMGTASLIVGANNNSATFSGTISGAGNLTKIGTGTQTLSGTNTYAGSTNVNAGELAVSGGAAIPDSSVVMLLDVAGAQLTVSTDETIASLTGGGASGGNVNLNAATLTTNGDNSSTTFAGILFGSGGLTKAGTGTFTLTAANTHTGTTNINAGMLLLLGSIGGVGNGVVNVNANATLAGTGTIGTLANPRNVNVMANATLAPGSPPSATGFFTVNGNATFLADSTFDVQVNGLTAGTNYDQLIVNGTPNVSNGTLSIALGFFPSKLDPFVLIANDLTDAVTGTFASLPEGAFFTLLGVLFEITYVGDTGNDVVIFVSDVVRRFDFNGQGAATQPGWDPVLPGQTKTAAVLGGWDQPVPTFDRFLPDLLLRDGHFAGFIPRTFQVDVRPNFAYQVLVTIGDFQFTHDFDRVTVYDGDVGPGSGQVQMVNTPIGNFATLVFHDVMIGPNGRLFIDFVNVGGSDRCFVVNAIDIRPEPAVTSMSLVRTNPSPLLTPDPLEADGISIDTYSGTGAPPNTYFTITTTNGTIVDSADVDATRLGVQVQSNGSGVFTFQIQRPASSVDGTIAAVDTFGTAAASFLQAYRVAAVRRFDFNSGASPTATGFIGVNGDDLFTTTQGYGWETQAGDTDRSGLGLSALRRDLHLGMNNTFTIEVDPGTAYDVRVYMGDGVFAHDRFRVSAEGVPQYTVTSLPLNTFDIRTFTVASTDAELELNFADLGGNDQFFVVNGIDIATSGSLPGEFMLTAAAEADALPGGVFALSSSHVSAIAGSAIARWQATGLSSASLIELSDVEFVIEDLPPHVLSVADNVFGVIRFDRDAAGFGWYVDPSPSDDREFFDARRDVAGMDLLTAVMHEFGHMLGLNDVDAGSAPHDIMVASLPTGTRRVPTGQDFAMPDVSVEFDSGNGQLTVIVHRDVELTLGTFAGHAQVVANGTRYLGTRPVLATDVRAVVVHGSDGDDAIDLRGAADPLYRNLSSISVWGHSGDDALSGTSLADLLDGGDGDDRLNGNAGDDTLSGGDGDDTLLGGAHRDWLDGGRGDDALKGQGGTGDTLTGGFGDDVLDGGAGTDRVLEAGDVDFVLSNVRLTGLGTDVLVSIEQADLTGGDSHNRLDASGFVGNARLSGGGGNDRLIGGVGHDLLNGGAGHDSLWGGDGSDTLLGGAGQDVAAGGAGSDCVKGQGGSRDILSGGNGRATDPGDRVIGSADEIDAAFAFDFNAVAGVV